MKPLHLCCDSKSPHEYAHYIMLKNNHFIATDAFIGCKVPVDEVLPEVALVADNEELYFKADEWKSANMHKAVRMSRDGLYFKALDRKGAVIGTIQALEPIELDFTYPNFDSIIPNPANAQETKTLYFNTELLDRLTSAMGYPKPSYEFTYIAETKPLLVTVTDSQAIGICMQILKFK